MKTPFDAISRHRCTVLRTLCWVGWHGHVLFQALWMAPVSNAFLHLFEKADDALLSELLS